VYTRALPEVPRSARNWPRNINACHDLADKRKFPPMPFLQGQHQRYLIKQLRSFRNNKAIYSSGYKIAERYNHLMDLPAANLTNNNINDLATFFPLKPVKPLTIVPKRLKNLKRRRGAIFVTACKVEIRLIHIQYWPARIWVILSNS
jgi:cytochrome c553